MTDLNYAPRHSHLIKRDKAAMEWNVLHEAAARLNDPTCDGPRSAFVVYGDTSHHEALDRLCSPLITTQDVILALIDTFLMSDDYDEIAAKAAERKAARRRQYLTDDYDEDDD